LPPPQCLRRYAIFRLIDATAAISPCHFSPLLSFFDTDFRRFRFHCSLMPRQFIFFDAPLRCHFAPASLRHFQPLSFSLSPLLAALRDARVMRAAARYAAR
jgi:hypothetical protein